MTELESYHLIYLENGTLRRFSGPVESEIQCGSVTLSCSSESSAAGEVFSCTVKAEKAVELREFFVTGPVRKEAVSSVFRNGFQSWTESREYFPEERLKGIRRLPGNLFKLKYYGDYHFFRYPGTRGRVHSYTYTYARTDGKAGTRARHHRAGDTEDGELLFFGSLSEEEGYTIFEWDLKTMALTIRRDCEGTVVEGSYPVLSILETRGSEDEVFDSYADALGGMRISGKGLFGWTSWYNYYTSISERIIISNLEHLRDELPGGDVFQIDDGYQESVGDWLDIKNTFPRGMKFVADRVKEAGYIPGLWLAPFACEKRSRVFLEHPDWVLRDDRDKPVPAGWNPSWSGTFYALDFDIDGARTYLERVFKTVFDEWGYGMVKLDFLYAAALVSKHGKNRGQIMSDACKFLRTCAGDNLILGCGVPLGSCFKVFDYCRIGSDVALKWEDRLLKFFRYRERVSTVNSLMSTVGRRHLGGRMFGNDPDVFILRDSGNTLMREQKLALFYLNGLLGQLVFTSDDVEEYTPEQREMLRMLPRFQESRIHSVKAGQKDITVEFTIEGKRYSLSLDVTGENIRISNSESPGA